jgi:hypothetical protein
MRESPLPRSETGPVNQYRNPFQAPSSSCNIPFWMWYCLSAGTEQGDDPLTLCIASKIERITQTPSKLR